MLCSCHAYRERVKLGDYITCPSCKLIGATSTSLSPVTTLTGRLSRSSAQALPPATPTASHVTAVTSWRCTWGVRSEVIWKLSMDSGCTRVEYRAALCRQIDRLSTLDNFITSATSTTSVRPSVSVRNCQFTPPDTTQLDGQVELSRLQS